jgi:hypothetical protein
MFAIFSQGKKVLLICVFFLIAGCQPQTKRDRAGVGPEVVATSGDGNGATESGGDSAPDASGSSGPIESEKWESSLKSLCEQGKPSACSQLAYDAERAQRSDEAIGYFTRACLMDVALTSCATPAAVAKGLARSCSELSRLYVQKGRAEDAGLYKRCACERGFKPACG